MVYAIAKENFGQLKKTIKDLIRQTGIEADDAMMDSGVLIDLIRHVAYPPSMDKDDVESRTPSMFKKVSYTVSF